jgi:hypothetical protein
VLALQPSVLATCGAGVRPPGALRGSDAVRPAGRHDAARTSAGRSARRCSHLGGQVGEGLSDSLDVVALFVAHDLEHLAGNH